MNRLLFIIIISWVQSVYAQNVTLLDKQLQKSIVLFEKGQVAKAERLLDKLIAQEGSYAPVYVWKGKCLETFEEFSAAYEAYYVACQLEPNVANNWLAMGNFKRKLGGLTIQKPTACGECGKHFLPLNETPASSAYFRSAVEDYQRAIALDNHLVEALYQLGLTYTALGKQEAACVAIAKAAHLGYNKALNYQKEHCTTKN